MGEWSVFLEFRDPNLRMEIRTSVLIQPVEGLNVEQVAHAVYDHLSENPFAFDLRLMHGENQIRPMPPPAPNRGDMVPK